MRAAVDSGSEAPQSAGGRINSEGSSREDNQAKGRRRRGGEDGPSAAEDEPSAIRLFSGFFPAASPFDVAPTASTLHMQTRCLIKINK